MRKSVDVEHTVDNGEIMMRMRVLLSTAIVALLAGGPAFAGSSTGQDRNTGADVSRTGSKATAGAATGSPARDNAENRTPSNSSMSGTPDAGIERCLEFELLHHVGRR